MSLINNIIREYPESIEIKIDELTFIFKPIKNASDVWLARKRGQDLSRDVEKGRMKMIWGDVTPEVGDIALMASILSDFCIEVKGFNSDGEEISEKPTIKDFLFLAKNDYQRFAEIMEKFYAETSFNKISNDEYEAIEQEKKI